MEKKSIWKDFQQHLMTGISYMIPVIVPAGIIMGIGIMIGQFVGFDAWDTSLLTSEKALYKLVGWFTQIAGSGMMRVPFFQLSEPFSAESLYTLLLLLYHTVFLINQD